MPVPGYTPGQPLLISDVNGYLTVQAAWKTAELGRAAVTAPAADPDLQLFLPDPDGIYQVKAVIRYNGLAGANNLLWTWGFPAGAAFTYSHWNYFGTPIAVPATAAAGTPQSAYTDGTAARFIMIARGAIIMGGAAGVLSFNWAQTASSATNTVVSFYSHITSRKIG